MKILIVEDDKVSEKLADSILTKNGFETILANSVKAAVGHIHSGEKISLILLDLNLPDKDGFSLLTYLKSQKLIKKMPVIICSSAEDKNSVMQSISLGAVGYLKKPIKSEILLSKIAEIISKRHQTILIVDDEKMIRNLLCVTLEREGYNTVAAKSGEDALQILDNHHIDAVISDIQMNEMSGLDLLKAIRLKQNELPVMMITGHSKKYSKADMDMAGADGYIIKPFKNFEIIDAVRNVLASRAVS
ncbi:MAG: hypothetical protein DRP51_07805 [Candidatus Zixiibacteriota bacterium]|nr:MAG: hypothetical protein DRP51_07805 [candidate division Zixibacteria bacterium]